MFRPAVLVLLFFVLTGISTAPGAVPGGRTGSGPGSDGPVITGQANQGANPSIEPWRRSRIDSLSPTSAAPGESVTIGGRGFGSSPGYIVLTGFRIDAAYWSDSSITFLVPDEVATGPLCIRNSLGGRSNSAGFTVERTLEGDQFEPHGFEIDDVGLPGPAFLVETDGEYLYTMSGFERLATYRIKEGEPYEHCGTIYLPQRVGDLTVFDGHLYVAGDHGLWIYRCSDLQAGTDRIVAAVAGGSFMTCDAGEKNGVPVDGTFVALCEHRSLGATAELRVPLFRFEAGELEKLGTFTRPIDTGTERQFALEIDPLNPKVYVSGCKTLLGRDKYILEIDVTDPAAPLLNHREETGQLLALDMDAASYLLWTGVVKTGYTFFQTYLLQPGTGHLLSDETVRGSYGLGRTTRLKIIDDEITVGSAWHGARPDVLLMSTFDNGPQFKAETSSIDWAFDISGYAKETADHDGKIFVADEWGGFMTYNYQGDPLFTLEHEPEHQVMAAAMTEWLHIAGDRIYVAGRGAGPWSADRHALFDESSWRSVAWDWSEAEPQPYPLTSLCTRVDPQLGTLIVGQGHEKAMAWGNMSYAILYQETADSIVHRAMSREFNPAGTLGTGVGAVWPETDLVYMTMGSQGIRAFVVDPDPAGPTITVHKDCDGTGFGSDIFATKIAASCMKHYRTGTEEKLVVGAKLGGSAKGIYVFDIEYPEGVPDRDDPDRSIVVTLEHELNCTKGKSVFQVDVTDTGLAVAATDLGLILFHLSWIPVLNTMGEDPAWDLIKVPGSAYSSWWRASWGQSFDGVCFKDESTLFCVKEPYGIWKIDATIDWANYTHDCLASAYYPGVQCGMDLNNQLAGWGNPDIVTLHHPYALATDGDSVYVTGWSGKVYRVIEN